jgi:hypothetical protein
MYLHHRRCQRRIPTLQLQRRAALDLLPYLPAPKPPHKAGRHKEGHYNSCPSRLSRTAAALSAVGPTHRLQHGQPFCCADLPRQHAASKPASSATYRFKCILYRNQKVGL